MIGEYPEKSWSLSKHKILNKCPREFYFTKFYKWRGWEDTVEYRKKLAYRLDKITTIEKYLGNVVHDFITINITTSSLNNKRDAVNFIGNKFNIAIKDSYKHKKQWFERPKDYVMFHSVYYNTRKLFDDNFGRNLKEKTEKIINNYFSSDTYQRLKEEHIKYEVDETNFPHFFINDYKIYSIIDLMFEQNGKIYIVDWKTGKPSKDDEFQLRLYALYASLKYGFPLEDIILINEYLLYGYAEERVFKNEDIIEVEEFIKEQIKVLEGYLKDSYLNIPKDEEYFVANPSINNCKWCNFKEICPAYKEMREKNKI
ncbi:ATP-dependent exonuclase V beta subunit, helicase and exonuclease domain-containing [Marinitoga piezophila KA3]|uniref:ATP-dependent exonuclase V beta subunit, helicase and exonuclease domain-containing n=1 Tax=Marinitoga piezophila (strain DSM 14283 / JCM 11233 / KA3) TaxID=443254 RepID=H2J2Q6_MARPK|nr:MULTISPECIES: PD-(D/E)XK nuclease family protein [Marinitoga]AEX84500.1 ATP-dependent exonuclase V beta subunit, helicase and exonuclease domain-containing [Marinitoga piezophila KA3]